MIKNKTNVNFKTNDKELMIIKTIKLYISKFETIP